MFWPGKMQFMRMKNFLWMIFFAGAVMSISVSFAADNSSSNGKLSELISKIKNVKQLLHQHKSAQLGLQKELQKTELAINDVSQKLNQSIDQLHTKEKKIKALLLQQEKIETDLARQQHDFLQQIRVTYLLGLNKNETEILLQANDPEKIDRLLTYNRFLTQRTREAIKSLKNNLTLLQESQQSLQTHTDQLKKIQQQQISQQLELDNHKHKQQNVLLTISQQVKDHTQELAQLIKNKENLEKTIQDLHSKENYSSDFLTHHTGKFPWPIDGKILERFGSGIGHSELKQNGVLIASSEGQPVKAVAPGKVIFANWMPGYGLLLIIDHGKGYMTLYGNNTILYKKKGDLVTSHELVAKVGHTGGAQKSGLYFALRHQGKPMDPCIWCGKK